MLILGLVRLALPRRVTKGIMIGPVGLELPAGAKNLKKRAPQNFNNPRYIIKPESAPDPKFLLFKYF